MADDIKNIFQNYQDKFNNKNFFTTGFYDLDCFCQLLSKGNIMIIGGRTAIGKTSFEISIINHLLENKKKVLLFSLSSSKENIINRLIADKMNVPFQNFASGNFDKTNLNNILNFYENVDLSIIDRLEFSISELEEMIKNSTPDVLFIDYVQLLNEPDKKQTFYEIKRIAKTYGIIVILISQISKRVESRENKRPLLSDFGEWDILGELSDFVAMIYRDSYYPNHTDNNLAEIIISKNNFGPIGTAYLSYENGYYRNPLKQS